MTSNTNNFLLTSVLDIMPYLDGFKTTDSFRYDHHTSSASSSISLSSSSSYGSHVSLSSSSNRRHGLTKYFKEKLSRHKSLVSLLFSSKHEINTSSNEIYEDVWNLDEQIDRLRMKIQQQQQQNAWDTQSMISMSVDSSESFIPIDNDDELLFAAPWYQEGLPRYICEEYLKSNHHAIGSFIIRQSYTHREYPFVLSIKTNRSLIEHFLIERTNDYHYQGYRLQVCFMYK